METSEAIAQNIESLHVEGSPLDESTKEFMESRFGFDFSKVRIHTNKRAAESARVLNALAYTVGQNIVFRGKAFDIGL